MYECGGSRHRASLMSECDTDRRCARLTRATAITVVLA